MRPRSGAATALAIVAIVAGFPDLHEIGITWDEPRYFASVERIQAWASRAASPEWRDALSAESIREAWDTERYYNPHPPAYKIGMAVTDALLADVLGLPASYRLSSLLLFGLLLFLVVRWVTAVAGGGAGIAAGLSLLLMPRVFGHAHLAATDMPLTFFWFGATAGLFLYVRGGRRRWLLAGAACMGLGFATKFTAFLLPLALVPWMILSRDWKRSLHALAYGIPIALVVAVLVNPGAWPDPIGYQARLVRESLTRAVTIPISTHYRGASYGYLVPWEHPIVMTLITVPVAILGLAAVGMKTAMGRRPTRDLATVCVVQVVFFLALVAIPRSPNHDGVRLWLPMFPFLAVAAGLGFEALREALSARLPPRSAAAGVLVLGAVYFAPPLLGTVSSRPFYLSYYGEVVGGASGADHRGMEATYWFDAVTSDFRRDLEAVLPDSARVLTHPSDEYFRLLQELGLVRADLVFTDDPPAEYFLLLGRKAMFDADLYEIWRRTSPTVSRRLDGVELVGLYPWASVGDLLSSYEQPGAQPPAALPAVRR